MSFIKIKGLDPDRLARAADGFDFIRSARDQDFAAIHNGNAVTKKLHLFHVVGGVHNGRTFVPELEDTLQNPVS